MLRGIFDHMPLSSVVKGLQACRLPAIRPLPSVVKGVQACPQTPKTSKPSPGTHATALCCYGPSSLPFASRQATVSVVKGVQACRLPALKPLKCLKRSAAASTRRSCHCPLLLRARSLPFASLQATALCCEGRSACHCQPSNQTFLLDNTILQRKFAGTAREPTLQPMLSNVQQRSLSLLIFCVPFCPERANVSSGIAFPPACHAWPQFAHLTAMTKQQLSRPGNCAHDTVFPCWLPRPWHETDCRTRIDGRCALSWHFLLDCRCKMDTGKPNVSLAQHHPSQKICSHRPFGGLFAPSLRHWSHARGTNVDGIIRFRKDACVFHRKAVPADRSWLTLHGISPVEAVGVNWWLLVVEEGGVGGTRALAHSISHYSYVQYSSINIQLFFNYSIFIENWVNIRQTFGKTCRTYE